MGGDLNVRLTADEWFVGPSCIQPVDLDRQHVLLDALQCRIGSTWFAHGPTHYPKGAAGLPSILDYFAHIGGTLVDVSVLSSV
eukprot:3375269-Amphidinium_carterae.1